MYWDDWISLKNKLIDDIVITKLKNAEVLFNENMKDKDTIFSKSSACNKAKMILVQRFGKTTGVNVSSDMIKQFNLY